MLEALNTWSGPVAEAGLWHFVQVAVLGALLAVVDTTLGRRLGAHWRCALWLLFFLKLALPPQLSLPTSPAYWWRGDTPPAPVVDNDTMAPVTTPAVRTESPPRTMQRNEEVAPRTPTGTSTTTPSWQTIIVGCWLIGAITLATLTLVRQRRLAAMLRSSTPPHAALEQALARACSCVGLRRSVALKLTTARIGPIVVGLWRPTIHLPQALADSLAPDQLHAVLVHELHHVKRGDLWVSAVQAIARVVFFHHPAVWLVNVHLARLREVATDRAVLAHPEVGRQSYSFALLEAAAFAASPAPSPGFALGVVETKSQLQKRIVMNLSHPRSGHRHLGLPGLATLLIVALVLVPMMPAEPAGGVVQPAGFSAVDAGPLLDRINKSTTSILEAFNRRDRDAYLAAFSEVPLLLPDGAGYTSGREGVAQIYLQSPAELFYEPMIWSDRQVYRIDRWIIETGLVGFQFRLAPQAPVMSDPRQALSIWEEGSDGRLRVKLLAWNKLTSPDELERTGKPQAFDCTLTGGPLTAEGDFAAVLEAEETFHHAFEMQKPEKAVPYYAEGAILIVPGALPLNGRAAILRHIQGTPPDKSARKIERQVAHVEGNRTHVLVVNLFRWTFQPAEYPAPVSIVGKGVHLWQRDPDGVWRILFDLPNVSQQSAG